MESSRKTPTANDFMLERLAENLDSTSRLTHALLTEIRESEADFASIKTELAILRENVKSLSVIIREGNGATSLLTKIALIEQQLENIDKWINNHVDTHQRLMGDISNLKEKFHQIEDRLSEVEKSWYTYMDKLERKAELEEEEQRLSYHRDIDLAQEKEKLDLKIKTEKESQAIKVKAERQSLTIKILAAVILGLVGFLGTWITAVLTSAQ